MSGPAIHTKRFPVPGDAIDQQGHVSNLAYVAWMQDVAIDHSAAAGWPMERYLALGAGWVVWVGPSTSSRSPTQSMRSMASTRSLTSRDQR